MLPEIFKTPPSNIYETERLYLKELNPQVMRTLLSDFSMEHVANFLGLQSEADLSKEYKRLAQGMTMYGISFRGFLLIEKASGRAIGRCGYHTWYTLHSRAEVGYGMHSDEHKGKGYMTEALSAIVKLGFEEMQLNRIEAFIAPHNEPSVRMAKRLGFTEEGTLRQHYYKNNLYESSTCFSLLKDEYERALS